MTASGLTVAAYPDNSTTEITAGITTTFTSGFDARAGLVNVRVAATTGNGYASGSTYFLVVTAGTVDSVSIVGEVVGAFSLGRSAANTLIGALSTSAATGDPGTTVTVVGYLKQLVNVLVGTAGIATFPAEAAPGNAVSLAEVIRAIHADVTGLNGSAMRGTDSAALASVCTEARLSELDAGTAGKAANVIDAIFTDTDATIPGLIAALNDLSAAAVNAEVDTALADIGLDHLLSAAVIGTDVVDNSVVARLVSSGATADWDTFVNTTDSLQALRDHVGDGTNLTVLATAAALATVDTNVDAILVDTDTTIPGLIAALNDLSAAAVNAEVVDALATDTYAEPTGVPAATASLASKIGYLAMRLRNKKTVTSTKLTIFDDADAAEYEHDLSDDGTTYTESEANAVV